MPRKGVAGIMQESGRLNCRGTDDNISDAIVEITLDRFEIAYAAAELDGNFVIYRFNDGANSRLIFRPAGKCTIEVHEMQSPRALIQPMPGHGAGIIRKYRGVFHHALS